MKVLGKSIKIQQDYGHCYYEFVSYFDRKAKIYKLDYVHIYDLFILPKFRKQGKARKLLRMVIKKIRKIGYNGIIKIVANPKDISINKEKLITFYKKEGLDVYEFYG